MSKVNALAVAPRQLILNIIVNFIIFYNIFAYEILPMDTVWSW